MKKFLCLFLCLFTAILSGCGKDYTIEEGKYQNTDVNSESMPTIEFIDNRNFAITYYANFTLEPITGNYVVEDNRVDFYTLGASEPVYQFDITEDNVLSYAGITTEQLKMLNSDDHTPTIDIPSGTEFVLVEE